MVVDIKSGSLKITLDHSVIEDSYAIIIKKDRYYIAKQVHIKIIDDEMRYFDVDAYETMTNIDNGFEDASMAYEYLHKNLKGKK